MTYLALRVRFLVSYAYCAVCIGGCSIVDGKAFVDKIESAADKPKMAVAGDEAAQQLREITECSICISAFIDPRMLPCIHTFCFECLKRTAETVQKTPEGKMPCPLCRKEFTIPPGGIVGVQKNFFMENLMVFKNTLQSKHPTLEIGIEKEKDVKRITNVKSCSKHTQKPLDYYCADCKQIVCVSCFVESHKLCDCNDVTTVDEAFRQMIKEYAWKTSNYADEMLSLKKNAEVRKADFLRKIVENETAIIKRSQELKNMIDEHTQSLLDELSVMNSCHQKEMEIKMEEIDLYCTALRSFEAYCTELRSKGSASDICSAVDKVLVRADELERDHEEFIDRSVTSVEVSCKTTDLAELLQKSNNNFVGQIKETTAHIENYAVVLELRMARVELGKNHTGPSPKNVLVPTKREKKQKCIELKYNCAKDLYLRGKEKIVEWVSLVFEAENMMRKVEYDWNMVYLARVENCNRSKITWKVELSSCGMLVDSVEIDVHSACFENGKVVWELCGDQRMVKLTSGKHETVTELRDSKFLLLTATLTLGYGKLAWQHTQLFRQKRFPKCGVDLEWPFSVVIHLKN